MISHRVKVSVPPSIARCVLCVGLLLMTFLSGAFTSELHANQPKSSYPRVYSQTGKLYGPTQAHYQYARQYGRPWHGYRGINYPSGFGNHRSIVLPSYPSAHLGYSPYACARPSYGIYPRLGLPLFPQFVSPRYYLPFLGGGYYRPLPYTLASGFPNGAISSSRFGNRNPYARSVNYYLQSPYNHNVGYIPYGYQPGILQQSSAFLPQVVPYSATYSYNRIYGEWGRYGNRVFETRSTSYPISPAAYSTNGFAPSIIPAYYPQPGFVNPAMLDALYEQDLRWKGELKPVEVVVKKPTVPTSPDAQIKSIKFQSQGDQYLQKGQYRQATIKYQLAQAAAYDRPAPYYHHVVALMLDKKYGDAVDKLKEAVSTDPGAFIEQRTLTKILGDENKARKQFLLEELMSWVKQDIRDPKRLLLMGFTLRLDNKDEQAKPFLETAGRLGGMNSTLSALLFTNKKTTETIQTNNIPPNSQSGESIQNKTGQFPGEKKLQNSTKGSTILVPPIPLENSTIPPGTKENGNKPGKSQSQNPGIVLPSPTSTDGENPNKIPEKTEESNTPVKPQFPTSIDNIPVIVPPAIKE